MELGAAESGDVLGLAEAGANNPVGVRAARAADVQAMAAIQARSWGQTYADLVTQFDGEGSPFDLAAMQESWRAAVTSPPSPAHRVLVAITGSTVVGFAAVAGIEIAVLVVDPSHQRRGHGSRLLAAVVDGLRTQERSRVQAWAAESDTALLSFFAEAGMVPDGARRIYTAADGSEIVEHRVAATI